jgi:hypothetical protein
MQRGSITITRQEAKEALKFVGDKKEYPIYAKLESAGNDANELVSVMLSEDELEDLLDEIGLPEEGEPEERNTLRRKLREFLVSLR